MCDVSNKNTSTATAIAYASQCEGTLAMKGQSGAHQSIDSLLLLVFEVVDVCGHIRKQIKMLDMVPISNYNMLTFQTLQVMPIYPIFRSFFQSNVSILQCNFSGIFLPFLDISNTNFSFFV
jgi:hypothetical protein